MAGPAACPAESRLTHKRHPRLWVAAAQNGPVAYSAGRFFPDFISCLALRKAMRRRYLIKLIGGAAGVVDSALRKIGMTRKVAVTVPDFASAARLAMPSRIAVHYSKHYQLNVFELPLQLPELDIAVAFHRRALSDPAIIWLMNEIRGDVRRANVNGAGSRCR